MIITYYFFLYESFRLLFLGLMSCQHGEELPASDLKLSPIIATTNYASTLRWLQYFDSFVLMSSTRTFPG